MARTGIGIKIADTVLGGLPSVDSNSILFVVGATASTSGTLAFNLGTAYMLTSLSTLEDLGIDADNNPDVFKQVTDYYSPKGGVSNSGNLLWLVGVAEGTDPSTLIEQCVRETTVTTFSYRPRQIGVFSREVFDVAVMKSIQAAIDTLYTDGYHTVGLLGGAVDGDIKTVYSTITDLSQQSCPLVGGCITTNELGGGAQIGSLLGFLASITVGTSIGDMQLSQFGTGLYFTDQTTDETNPDAPVTTAVNTPCAELSTGQYNILGDKNYIFARTRPPFDGLWWNDGATGEASTNALSDLEHGRVIASLCDKLREYFTRYINTRVPVQANGDLDAAYRQVVLTNGRVKIIQPFIDSGDISDAELDLRAKNDDFIGTRTWEVTLKIQSASTLRWVDGFVFYVSQLT